MRLVEFFNEAKFRKPVVMYHGTSNAHIRSILKRGIIPEPVEKVWATDPDLSPHSFSRASLRGSYWSANLGTASSSSTTATYQKHFGGSPLIVVAQISEGSAYADEDDLNFQINWAMGNMYHDLFGGNLISEAVPKASALYYWGEGKQNEMIQSFGEALHESASIDPKKQPIDWSFMEELLKAIMLRQLAYEVFEQERSKSYYKDAYVREMQRLQGEGKAPPIPSIEEAENILLRLREILTRMYRKTVYPEKSQSVLRNTLRTAQPVTYRGANKILAILGDPPRQKSDKGSEWWEKPKILYYGSPPEDYFKQYREFMGSFPGAVNTKGQMVIQPDEKKKVAASIGEAESSKDFDFGYDVTGAHHGQVDGVAYAYDSDSKVVYGLINWSSFEDETYINHIEVNPKFQRQGLATRMIAFLKDKNDNEPINWGMTTPEGTELRKAIGEAAETPRLLYHGTLKKHLPVIKQLGLQPSIGYFVKKAYGDSPDLKSVVFASEIRDIGKVINAITANVLAEVGDVPITMDEFYEHGAVVVLKYGKQFKHISYHDDEEESDTEHPMQVEPGDFYSYNIIEPYAILIDKRLERLLDRIEMYPPEMNDFVVADEEEREYWG